MPVVNYPTWIQQCEPTSREEVTRVLSELSENGVVRGRVMHRRPTYQMTLSHMAMTKADFARWENWWGSNYNNEVIVTWVPDGVRYQGIFSDSPSVAYAPFQRFDVSVSLLVKKVATDPVVAIAGNPGRFEPVGNVADLPALQGLGALGNTAAWTTGQYVLLDDGSEAYWDGTAWATGRAP